MEEILFKKGEIVDIAWHGVERNILIVAYQDRLIQLNVSGDLDLSCLKIIQIDNITKIKNSPSGEYYIIIHNNGKTFTIYNEDFKSLYSKKLTFSKYSDVVIAPNSNYFVITQENNSVNLFNYLNMSFTSWIDFEGNVNNIQISENSNYIFVFTDNDQCPLYIIYNMVEDIYSSNYYDSYNNITQYYLQSEFKMAYKIFSFFNSNQSSIVKARINSLNNRLIILFKDQKGKTELKIFEIVFSKSVHELRFNLLLTMNNFRVMEITDFEVYFNFYRKTDLLVTLWNDQFLSLTYLNANDLNISNN